MNGCRHSVRPAQEVGAEQQAGGHTSHVSLKDRLAEPERGVNGSW
jgi:hypothetical protein